jgi:hypothetical protein
MVVGWFIAGRLCVQLHFTNRTLPVLLCKNIFTLFNCQGTEALWFPAFLDGYLPITG